MKICKELKGALDATGLPWELRKGSKHFKIYLAGRLVSVLPYGVKPKRSDHRNHQLQLKQIRQVAAEMKGKSQCNSI